MSTLSNSQNTRKSTATILADAQAAGIDLSGIKFFAKVEKGEVHNSHHSKAGKMHNYDAKKMLDENLDICSFCAPGLSLVGGWGRLMQAVEAMDEILTVSSLSKEFLSNKENGISNFKTSCLLLKNFRNSKRVCINGFYPKKVLDPWFRSQDMRSIVDVLREPFEEEVLRFEAACLLRSTWAAVAYLNGKSFEDLLDSKRESLVLSKEVQVTSRLDKPLRLDGLSLPRFNKFMGNLSDLRREGADWGLFTLKVAQTFNSSKKHVFKAPEVVAEALNQRWGSYRLPLEEAPPSEVVETLEVLFKDALKGDGRMYPQELFDTARVLSA